MFPTPPRRYYAGIGSRKTPTEIMHRMKDYATELEKRGYILRSGGADGADSAFESGVLLDLHKDIYLPWKGFNGKSGIVVGDRADLREIAKAHHPVWFELSRGMRAMHTRNVAQILGHGSVALPSQFVLCWTPGARSGGGTGQAIRIAKAHHIPVYDLADTRNSFEKEWL